MLNLESEKTVKVPFRVDEGGTVRVGKSGVSLLSVLNEFQNGATPEQIVQDFDSLGLEDVYAVLAYYLNNRTEVEAWLAQERAEGARLQKEIEAEFPQAGIRDRLLRRKTERQGSP